MAPFPAATSDEIDIVGAGLRAAPQRLHKSIASSFRVPQTRQEVKLYTPQISPMRSNVPDDSAPARRQCKASSSWLLQRRAWSHLADSAHARAAVIPSNLQ